MNFRCCPNYSANHFPIPQRRTEENEDSFVYATEDEGGRTKEFQGTFSEFENTVLSAGML